MKQSSTADRPQPNELDMQFEYVEGQGRPGFPALLAEFQRLSEQASVTTGALLDLPYGPHARQRFDHFPATTSAVGVLLYYHAGYWQSRDKSQFRFLAPDFQRRGFHFVAVNYPLCPEVSLAGLVESVGPSVAAVRQHLHAQGVHPLPLVVSGHSAGAHLAVELALANAPGPIAGVLGISGVYNPEPLLQTTLNQKLLLTHDAARASNVTRRVRPELPPGLWVVGGAETRSFIDQNTRMHEAWLATGNASESLVVPDADHFTVLQNCVRPDGEFAQPFDAWWSRLA